MRYALLALGLSVAFAVAACGDDDDGGEATTTSTAAESGEPAESPALTDAPSNTPEPATPTPYTGVCTENPDPADPDILQIEEPDNNAEVTSPIIVRGVVLAFEARFQIALKDADGNDITLVNGMSSEGQTLAPFQEAVSFSVVRETDACLWVYEVSPRDGSIINVAQVPVKLQAGP